jgi:ribonuclease D
MHIDLPAPELVQDPRRLQDLVAELREEPKVAIDTEADSFFCYREKVCLVQISTRERDWLIDPLADLDLGPLGELLADPAVCKVFHDGEYDVLILKREHGFSFKNLFDTRVAAAALGSPNPGLASVLGERFGIELDKSMQRSNWGQRPLQPKQIAYAQLDTHYLLGLMDEQEQELQRMQRRMVVEAECERLERLEPPDARFEPDEWVRIKGARTLDPRRRRALRELFISRDEIARRADVPPFRTLGNPVLLEVARSLPRNARELASVAGLSPGQLRRHGPALLEALERARDLEPIQRFPQLVPKDGTGGLDEAQVELYERLKAWRREQAAVIGFDASLVLNRHALVEIARSQPTQAEDLARIVELARWQSERFGAELLALVDRFRRDLAQGKLDLGRRRSQRP